MDLVFESVKEYVAAGGSVVQRGGATHPPPEGGTHTLALVSVLELVILTLTPRLIVT